MKSHWRGLQEDVYTCWLVAEGRIALLEQNPATSYSRLVVPDVV